MVEDLAPRSMRRTSGQGRGIEIEVAKTYGELSQKAADFICAELKNKPALLLCASAGGTPTGTYQALAARYSRQPRLFSQMHVLQIDEWGGLPEEHPATCQSDLRTKLINPLHITANRFTALHTAAADRQKECERVSNWLAANGPIDICLLGLGANGHIAMNEPAESLEPGVHVARLAKSSQKHGMLTDLAKKPSFGFSLGMRDILNSRMLLLLVSGAHKQGVLKKLLQPLVTTQLPASFVWLHARTVLICDREAADESLD